MAWLADGSDHDWNETSPEQYDIYGMSAYDEPVGGLWEMERVASMICN